VNAPTRDDFKGMPVTLRGCGCGMYHLPSEAATFEVEGVVHRFSRACYRAGESKQLGALPDELDELKRLRSRVKFLEDVLAAREGAAATRTAWGDACDGVTAETPGGKP
jgi:hypothetical protein